MVSTEGIQDLKTKQNNNKSLPFSVWQKLYQTCGFHILRQRSYGQGPFPLYSLSWEERSAEGTRYVFDNSLLDWFTCCISALRLNRMQMPVDIPNIATLNIPMGSVLWILWNEAQGNCSLDTLPHGAMALTRFAGLTLAQTLSVPRTSVH